MRLGQPIAESAPSYPGVDYPPTRNTVMTLGSPNFSTGPLLTAFGSTVVVNETWFGASLPVAYPFVFQEPTMVYQLGWNNGANVAGNIDAGIYDMAWNRIVSAGSTAAAGSANSWQWADVTDTLVVAGYYYLVICKDSVTASRSQSYNSGLREVLVMAGVMDSATTAFPLPDPLTNMVTVATMTRMTCCGIATKAVL